MNYRIINMGGNVFAQEVESNIRSLRYRIKDMCDWDEFRYSIIRIEDCNESNTVYFIGYVMHALDWCDSIVKE